jgi:Holliday junction resolvase-like predicted endonuclease
MDTGVVSRARTGRTSRRQTGDRAEEAVAAHLAALGWRILGRNVRVGRCELDIVALDVAGALVIVEVRSRSAPGFGAPEESVDAGKVARLYGAGWQLASAERLPDGQRLPDGVRLAATPFRVDLVTVVRLAGSDEWTLGRHVKGLSAT